MTKCLKFTEEEVHNALANIKHDSKHRMNSLTELESSYARTMIKSMASQKPQESCRKIRSGSMPPYGEISDKKKLKP